MRKNGISIRRFTVLLSFILLGVLLLSILCFGYTIYSSQRDVEAKLDEGINLRVADIEDEMLNLTDF